MEAPALLSTRRTHLSANGRKSTILPTQADDAQHVRRETLAYATIRRQWIAHRDGCRCMKNRETRFWVIKRRQWITHDLPNFRLFVINMRQWITQDWTKFSMFVINRRQ